METRNEIKESGPRASELFAGMHRRQSVDEYNFDHFRTRHFLYDARATKEKIGIHPGALAPDFTLPIASGGTLRLADLRDRPVVLRFGSPS